MAINLADKFEKKVSERYHAKSYTQGWAGAEYSFDGVKTIKIYSINTVPLQKYARNAFAPEAGGVISFTGSRYGTAFDITDTETQLTMGEDRSFTYVIDKGEGKQQYNIKSANRALTRECDEVITPYMDKYNITKWAREAGLKISLPTGGLDKTNIAEFFIDINKYMNERFLPEDGRVAYVKSYVLKAAKLCDEFDGISAKESRITAGHVGTFDGINLVWLPESYFPANVDIMVIAKSALLAPMKLKEYKIHVDPPGLSGDLVEGRIIHDAFIVPHQRDRVGLCLSTIPADYTFAEVTGSETTHIKSNATAACSIFYTTNGADPMDEWLNNNGGLSANAPVAGGNLKLAGSAALVKSTIATGADVPNNAFQMYYRTYDASNGGWGNLHRQAFAGTGYSGNVDWGNEF